MTGAIVLLAALAVSGPAEADGGFRADTEVDVRRVAISIGFAGQVVFVHGSTPDDLEGLIAVVEAPAEGDCRVMEQGRFGPIWLGLRQFRVGALPALYLVLAHDPDRNRLGSGEPSIDLDGLNRRLATAGAGPVGPAALAPRVLIERVGGIGSGGEPSELLDSLWALQAENGLFGVDLDGIRVSPDGMYYYRLTLPQEAPEGRYTVTTYYLRGSGLVTERSTLLVRKTGAVALMTRFAGRHAPLYGITTVLLAIAVGWLVGALERGRNGL